MRSRIAYTIGAERSYDEALEDARTTGVPVKKTGPRSDYPGGWCFPEFEDAVLFIRNNKLKFKPAVYKLELPDNWESCTRTGDDEGSWNLTTDAIVTGKVELP